MKTSNLLDTIATSPFTVPSDLGVVFCKRLCKQRSSNRSKAVSLSFCSSEKKNKKKANQNVLKL